MTGDTMPSEKTLNSDISESKKDTTTTDVKSISADKILSIAKFLSENLCENVRVYDVSKLYDYIDFCILATTTSAVHRRGVTVKLASFFKENDLDEYAHLISLRNREKQYGSWFLLDLSDFLIHLLDDEARTFYDFEKLFSKAALIYG